jgi:hypothetical protein
MNWLKNLGRALSGGLKMMATGEVVRRSEKIHEDIEDSEQTASRQVSRLFNMYKNDLDKLEGVVQNEIKLLSKRSHTAVNKGTDDIVRFINKI